MIGQMLACARKCTPEHELKTAGWKIVRRPGFEVPLQRNEIFDWLARSAVGRRLTLHFVPNFKSPDVKEFLADNDPQAPSNFVSPCKIHFKSSL